MKSPEMHADERRRIRVLVAEDHAVVRRALCLLLEAEGEMEVVGEAADGAEALAMWRAGDYDLILTDLHMPEMDGLALASEIRKLRPGLPFVLFSSLGRQEPGAAGFAGLLAKPLKPSQLYDLLAALFGGEQPATERSAGRPTQRAPAASPPTVGWSWSGPRRAR